MQEKISCPTSFSLKLQELMQNRSISKRALSISAGVERRSLRFWLNGKFLPRYDSLVFLADYFRVSTDALLGLPDKAPDAVFNKTVVENIPSVFRERLEGLLNKNHISRYKLALLLETGQSSVSKWLHASAMPETKYLIAIADIFHCSVDYLLGRTDIE